MEADKRIRSMAEKRGFVMTTIPVAPIEKTNEPRLSGDEDDLLQPLALKAWKELKEASKKDGLNMSVQALQDRHSRLKTHMKPRGTLLHQSKDLSSMV